MFSPSTFYLTQEELRNLPSVQENYTLPSITTTTTSNTNTTNNDHNPNYTVIPLMTTNQSGHMNVGPISITQELAYRKYTCAFIQEAGVNCKIPQLTIATALVFFQRFYAFHRFQDQDRHLVATTCIFLSTKVEETPLKMEVVIQASYFVQHKKEIVIGSPEYKQLEDKVLRMERLLLQTLKFDLKVEHPYRHLLAFLKKINSTDKRLAQTAWNFVNDSLRTTLCLQFPPEKIAASVIYLAAKYMDIMDQLPSNWLTQVDTDQETTENISTQILDLYEGSEHATKIKQSGGATAAPTTTTTTTTTASSTSGSSKPTNEQGSHDEQTSNETTTNSSEMKCE